MRVFWTDNGWEALGEWCRRWCIPILIALFLTAALIVPAHARTPAPEHKWYFIAQKGGTYYALGGYASKTTCDRMKETVTADWKSDCYIGAKETLDEGRPT